MYDSEMEIECTLHKNVKFICTRMYTLQERMYTLYSQECTLYMHKNVYFIWTNITEIILPYLYH